MKRIEIIGNRSIEEDLFDALKKREIASHYTKIPIVFGVGSSGPKQGDHIWPEENFLIIIYCSEKEADKILEAVKEVKTYFQDEGLKLFESELVCSV
jgi:nitrogen regulatory protein PII